MTRIEKTLNAFNDNLNCAQAIVATYGPDLGLEREHCIKIASGFGAGIAYRQEICGAVTGAIMVLGMKFGTTNSDPESKKIPYDYARKFIKQFESIHETVQCRELLGMDISTESGLKAAKESGIFKSRCSLFVRDAVEILDNLFF